MLVDEGWVASWSRRHQRRSLDQSLSRLGVGSIDIVLVPIRMITRIRRAAKRCRRYAGSVTRASIGAGGVGMNESATRQPARFAARPTSTS